MLVAKLLEESPDAAATRVAVIVNGLGSVKSEELFVLYGGIAAALEAAGLQIVEPEVGEYATSFEMAGVSLTVMWLDDELEQAWRSPAYTPAYRKGAVSLAAADAVTDDDVADEAITAAGPESATAGRVVASALAAVRAVIDRDVDELGRLDAIAGDGDHGIGMQRGARAADAAAAQAAAASAGAGTVLTRAGDAWADKAGGTSGALWGRGLRAAGELLGDNGAPDAATVAAAVAAARDAVQAFGKAEVGEKTLVDALVPFAARLAEQVGSGADLASAWTDAAAAATAAAEATADLLPRKGRARPHMAKSLGTPDPGAVSLARAMTAIGVVLTEHDAHEGKEN